MVSSTAAAAATSKQTSINPIWALITRIFVSCIPCLRIRASPTRNHHGYAIYYPEGKSGYLLISHLGTGTQGAALLVLSLADHQLYVRKRKRFPCARFPAANEAELALPHSNIPILFLQIPYQGIDLDGDPSSTTADIWRYCNGGDLARVIDIYKEKVESVPAPIVWRFFRQLLNVVLHIQSARIIHRDIKSDNVFLHWTGGKDASLPDFFLGDFGIAHRLPLGTAAGAHTYDYVVLLGLVKQLMNPALVDLGRVRIPSGQEGSFAALEGFLAKMEAALFRVSGDGDLGGFEAAMRAVEKDLAVEGLKWEVELPGIDLGEMKVVEEGANPIVFETREALFGVESQPPGPWQVAEVERRGKQWVVKRVEQERHREAEAMYSADHKGRS
ncbi:uncharacterized protein HMPREF1541_06431 [Cyphellophora europaea CBS 101466]|uniref:non-specific serine/threonine protein kinase n=1 Tax=Cyphellophora europaea (strain CBS 101466) TaxID=1220924 RepID=W2RPH3_CYPE1|nr:uncharacterized protein HMPREF1541_06431 [Cyphellophora europaea CBS 101466]ETN38396.1 hypothetical protein HMPREF1541_06431 [Cyphellophora europaea CBS 101466]